MGLGPVDVLAFGPHPDDIEIGMGATVAEHVARGLSVGLCDLTRGEMGSNGTVDERLREAEEARDVLGAAWRENLALPDRQLGDVPEQVRAVAALIRAARPSVVAAAVLGGSPSRSRRRQPARDGRRVQRGPQALCRRGRSLEAGLARLLLHQQRVGAFVPRRRLRVLRGEAARARRVTDRSSRRQAPTRRTTRLTSPLFNQLVESRDAQFGALAGVRWAEGFVVREPVMRRHLLKRRPSGAPRS